MKVLIIRFSSIGDIVLTTPVIRCLKKQVEGIELHYFTRAAFKPVLDANPYIDKIHVLDSNWESVIYELQQEEFDYVIDLHHNLRTVQVKRALKKRAYSFNKLNIEKWLYTSLGWNLMPDKHIVDRYLQTTESFGVKNDGLGLDYFIPDNERVQESDIPASHLAGYVGLVSGAAHNTKRLPLHKLKALCAAIDHPVILLGGKEDRVIAEEVAAIDTQKIYNACGKFSLNESADLVRRAKVIITHDTGLMHIAAAFRKPVISVWGNTVPEFGMYPHYPSDRGGQSGAVGPYDKIEVRGLWCRPCSKIGHDKCPLGHFNCMEKISVESIVQQLEKRLGRNR